MACVLLSILKIRFPVGNSISRLYRFLFSYCKYNVHLFLQPLTNHPPPLPQVPASVLHTALVQEAGGAILSAVGEANLTLAATVSEHVVDRVLHALSSTWRTMVGGGGVHVHDYGVSLIYVKWTHAPRVVP